MELSFTLFGDPVSKGRPRTGRTGHHYTPERTRKAEKAIRDAVIDLVDSPYDGPVAISVTFYCKTKRRTDLDNLEKLLCDAIQGVLISDDHWIWRKRSELHRGAVGEQPRTEVRLEALPHP